MHEWVREVPCAVTVCDRSGVIVEMNAKAERTFAKDGGAALVGKSLLDCHPPPAREKLARLLREGRSNSYTIEKNGAKKLIHQAPWYRDGEYAGLVEISIELPSELPHFVRAGGNPA